MSVLKRLVCGVSAVAFLALVGPVWAQGALTADAVKLYGGTYSSDCSNSAAPRLLVIADALVVEAGGRRMMGRNATTDASYFGRTPPPNYDMALMSSVGAVGTGLFFIVYHDSAGQYIVLDGGPRVMATLGSDSATKGASMFKTSWKLGDASIAGGRGDSQ